MNNYILDDNNKPILEHDLLKWGHWMSSSKRSVALTSVGEVKISTVFLGLDHSFTNGPPVLWETMIFGGKHDQYQERYTNYEDALIGHKVAVSIVDIDND